MERVERMGEVARDEVRMDEVEDAQIANCHNGVTPCTRGRVCVLSNLCSPPHTG